MSSVSAETALALQAQARADQMATAMVRQQAGQEQVLADMLASAAQAGTAAALPADQGLAVDRTV